MKKTLTLFALGFAIIFTLTQCQPTVTEKPVVVSNEDKNCCADSCTISNNYCDLDNPNEIVSADIKIDTFAVSDDGAGHLLLKVHVSNNGDDDAHEAKLVVLLPIDVCNISVTKADTQIKSYKQCGGQIEFCLGQLATSGIAGARSIEIKTDMCKLASRKQQESFAGFVYSSTPDFCPLNNYKAWVNDSVICNKGFDAASLVKKGF